MPLTLREALRLEVGDTGTLARETFSGTGSKTSYWVGGSPIITSTAVGYVADTSVAITATSNGRVVFTTAPASGTDNVEIVYYAVILADSAYDEMLRQYSFGSPTADAEAPVSADFLRAAAHGCDVIAANFAGASDVSMDGTDLKRSQLAEAYGKRAEAIRERIRKEFAGLATSRIRRQDGYTVVNDVSSESVSTMDTANPRRNFYGVPDRLP